MRKITLPIFFSLIVLSIFFSQGKIVYALTSVLTDISTDTTWTLAGSPYVVGDPIVTDIYISSGVTLTIEPGVVVKFAPSTTLVFDQGGRVVANGTSGNKIYFTSLLDDTIDGDTNGDGGATTPDYSDSSSNIWFGINVSNTSLAPVASLSFSNVVMRYANCGLSLGQITDINITNSVFENNNKGICDSGQTNVHISDSQIKNNNKGIWLNQPDTSLVNSIYTVSGLSIYGNSVYGVQNTTPTSLGMNFPKWTDPLFWLIFLSDPKYAFAFDYTIDFRNIWWGDTSGPFNTTSTVSPNPSGLGNKVSDLVLFSPWTTTDPAYPTPYSTPYTTPYTTPYSTPYTTPYPTPAPEPEPAPSPQPRGNASWIVALSNNVSNSPTPTPTPLSVSTNNTATPTPAVVNTPKVLAKAENTKTPVKVAAKKSEPKIQVASNIKTAQPKTTGVEEIQLTANVVDADTSNKLWVIGLLIGLCLLILSGTYLGIYKRYFKMYKKYFRLNNKT